MSLLGRRLADIRTYEGLSQKEMAKVLSVAPNTISAYENGVKKPSIPKLLEIARHFNVSTDYILGLVDDRIPLDRKDAIILPKGFPAKSIPKAKEYIRLLLLENRSNK